MCPIFPFKSTWEGGGVEQSHDEPVPATGRTADLSCKQSGNSVQEPGTSEPQEAGPGGHLRAGVEGGAGAPPSHVTQQRPSPPATGNEGTVSPLQTPTYSPLSLEARNHELGQQTAGRTPSSPQPRRPVEGLQQVTKGQDSPKLRGWALLWAWRRGPPSPAPLFGALRGSCRSADSPVSSLSQMQGGKSPGMAADSSRAQGGAVPPRGAHCCHGCEGPRKDKGVSSCSEHLGHPSSFLQTF